MEIEQIAPAEGLERQEAGWLMVDVREQNEWDAARIPGAIHVPLSELQNRFEEIPRDRELVLQCAGGFRSQQAAMFLAEQGYERMANLAHGINGWARMGLPLEQ